MSEKRFAYQPIEKPDPTSTQQGNNVAISKFIHELRKAELSESTLTSYESCLNRIMSGIYVPIMSITQSLINERVSECYREGNWSEAYVRKVVSATNKFFWWAKQNMYTGLSINVINPATGKTTFSHNIQPLKDSQKASKSVDSSKPEPIRQLLESKVETTMADTFKDVESKKSAAIMALLRSTNLTPEEICTLDIYDFIHNRIIFQGHGNRHYMRIVPLDMNTRNLIYLYLSVRNDSCEALFLSENHTSERIQMHEVRKYF